MISSVTSYNDPPSVVLPTANKKLIGFAKLSLPRSYVYQTDVANVLESIQVTLDAVINVLPFIDVSFHQNVEFRNVIPFA